MQPRLERLYQQYKTGDKNVYKRLGGSGQALMRISISISMTVARFALFGMTVRGMPELACLSRAYEKGPLE